VLPAVSSLKALRAHAKVSRAGKAYLGIGNPLLDGHDSFPWPGRLGPLPALVAQLAAVELRT